MHAASAYSAAQSAVMPDGGRVDARAVLEQRGDAVDVALRARRHRGCTRRGCGRGRSRIRKAPRASPRGPDHHPPSAAACRATDGAPAAGVGGAAVARPHMFADALEQLAQGALLRMASAVRVHLVEALPEEVVERVRHRKSAKRRDARKGRDAAVTEQKGRA